jgi:hypothetical protein
LTPQEDDEDWLEDEDVLLEDDEDEEEDELDEDDEDVLLDVEEVLDAAGAGEGGSAGVLAGLLVVLQGF